MSWEEYKKKREETSSWEQYKQKRQANVSKNTVTTKSSTNNKTSLWDNIQNLASETGKVADNLWQSFKNGVMSYQQTVGRAANNTQAQHADLINRMHQKALEGRLKDNPEETEQINKIINNPLISGDKIRQESKEYYNKIQEKKKENTLKIQQNAESMNTEVGKYIAGEIAPGIGQMLPGMIGGPIGTTYFIGSATGNYYDDAKQRGMTEDQATIYSGVMGIIEGSLEAVGAKLTTNVGKQLLRKNIKGALVNYGLDIGENFLEESIVEPLSEIVATTAAGKDKADWSNIGQRMWQSGVAGAITSVIMGGASGAIGSVGSKVTQQNKYVDYNTNKKLDQNSQDILKQAENIIQKNNATNLQPQTMQNTQNMPSQQLMPSQQENAHNTNMKINKTLPMQNYIYEKSDNVKIDRFRQSASQNFDNSIKSRNYLNMLEKIITDKDVDIIFDSNLKDSQGRIANGSYSNGVITINPNSNRTGEFIAIHELTHAIGTNQMRNIVEQYRKSNKAFDSAVQQLLKNYNTTELTEEAMADVSAQLFGNQEFINNLAEREPSLFRKIYNEIKYLWHQFTGYKNQNQFIEDLQYKWEQAYRNNNKLNETTNYYIEPVAKFDEIEYNNVIEEKLSKKEYAILRSIINSDSNIKPGINYVEVTNGRYTVYYKGFDDFKVMSRKVDADAGRINKRNDTTGRKTRYSKTFEQSIGNEGATASNDEISNFNKTGTRERSGSNSSSSTNIKNAIKLPTQESENNSGSFNLSKNEINKLTDKGIVMTYVRNSNTETANYGTIYGQNLEPAGEYMSMDTMQGEYKIPGFEYGTIEFTNPLIIEHKDTTANGWKKDLSEKYNGLTGKKLSEAIRKDGYDAVMTQDEDGNFIEIVNIDGNKQNPKNNSDSFNLQDNKGRTLTKEQQEYFKDSKARNENGNLIEVYHGTNEDFTEFDISYLGSASGDVGFLGDGFYLATHKGEAKYYGSKIMSGYVNIKNPYNIKDLSKYNGKTFNGEDSSNGLHIKNLVDLNPQWRNIEINNTTYGEIANEVTNYLENVKIKKLGIVEDSYGNDSGIMWETNFNGKKTQDESILNYTEEEMIANGLNKHIRNKFGYVNSNEVIQYITEANKFDKSIKTLREVLQEKGYDSIVQGTPQDTDEIVIFNSNQFKNVDNAKPTDNPDIRYSLPTKEWQQYLDENYKPTGTRTNLEDIRLPVKENSKKSSFNLPTNENAIKLPQKETNVDKYNRYKQNVLKGRAEEVNNLIKNKNETINEIEQQIKKKTQELNSKADKTTKVANNLKMQIENLKQRKTKIENEYNSRIDRKFDKVSKDKINLETKKELGITRKEIQQNLLEDSGIISESLDNAQNISMANMNRTDPIRLQEKVFGRELGTKINNMFFNKIKHNTAEKTRFLNSERNDIKNWGIKARSFESEVLQKYTEKTYVTGAGKEISYTEADLIKDVPNEETRNKIKKASEELRKKYDNYIETANEVLVGLGYDAIPKRKDYVRHFTELNDIFTKFGIPGKLDNALPTDINGITDTFRPGKNFFANAQKRHGNKTTYDAITGIDGYIEGISNLIYHTEDIQRLRALDKYIRESYGEKGFENLENLSEEERNARIQKISENHLSNYVSWLTEYTNNLAGKKSGIDRSVEKLLGRNVYSVLDTIKKQTGSNMTGFNIGSALTNFISVTQGASKTKKLALLKGTARTIQNIFNNDGFVDKSDFLTNRFGSDRISNTLWQKVSNVGQVFMSATDYFSSNLIVRSKYYENLAKGMSESEALKKADDFGARILGDRSQGSTANVFNSKMLGILTQFQLEVNNQMDTMMHDTIQDFKTIEGERGALKASMGAVWTLGQMAAYQYIFNNIFQAIAGRRPAFDVIDILKTALGIDDEDEEDSVKDNLQEAAIKLIEGLPFLNLLSEDARVPIASAIPNPISVATGDSTLKDEVSKLVYLLPPTGGSQAKKTIDGVKTVMDGGSYVTNSKGEKELRFPVENTSALDYIKAGTLGKYSLPLAQEYVDRDYKRLSAKQTKTYEESKVPFKEYLEYIEAGLKTNEDKINYLESKEMNTEQKWGIYTNDLFSSTERKEDGGSQSSDAKYITSNGVSKSEYIKIYNIAQKNNIDMPTAKEYKEMKSNNVTLKNYIEYKVKVKELTESKRKSKELSATENLKNADKIQILLDSNYSDKEISGIYDNYIKSEKDTEYDIMKETGINIKEYLKYKQQEFTSDKTDDGTLKGKTVSKSEQKKVVEYLNSNIKKGNQRLLLYAMRGYSMTASQKTQVANYVKELKIDKDTKLKLYDKFRGFTVYKDGTVEW